MSGDFLEAHWVRLCASIIKSLGSIPGRANYDPMTKIEISLKISDIISGLGTIFLYTWAKKFVTL